MDDGAGLCGFDERVSTSQLCEAKGMSLHLNVPQCPHLLYQSKFSPEVEPTGVCVYVYKDIYYKEFVYATMRSGKSANLQGESANWRSRRTVGLLPVWVQRPENQEEPMLHLEFKGRKNTNVPILQKSGRRILSYLGQSQPFVLLSPSTDQMRLACIRQNNLLYSVY